MLAAVLIGSIEACTIRPGFNTEPMLFILFPISNIYGAHDVFVCAVALGLIIDPVAVVVVSIGMDQTAEAIELVSQPIAFVF